MCFRGDSSIGLSRSGDVHAANLALTGNDDDLEIGGAAFAAQGHPQYSHFAELLSDLGLDVAEDLYCAVVQFGANILRRLP